MIRIVSELLNQIIRSIKKGDGSLDCDIGEIFVE
jgi:hypothetical protein